MGYTVEFDNVLFDEGVREGFTAIGPISVDIGLGITSAQLKNLKDVKAAMAAKARDMGGNCICDFTYGQRSSGLLASIFSRDDTRWYGHGTVGRVAR